MKTISSAVRAGVLLAALMLLPACPGSTCSDDSQCGGGTCCHTVCMDAAPSCPSGFAYPGGPMLQCVDASNTIGCKLPASKPKTPAAALVSTIDTSVDMSASVDMSQGVDMSQADGSVNLDLLQAPDLSPFACGSSTCLGQGYTCYNNLTCLACNIPQYCGPSCVACTGATPFCCSDGTCGVMGVGGCL